MPQDDKIRAMEACISDFKVWMANHQLKLNDENTECVIIGSRRQLSKLNISDVFVDSSESSSLGQYAT